MHELTQALTQGVIFGSIYAVAAVGFALVYNTTVIFHVAYGAIANIGVLISLSFNAGVSPTRLLITVPLGMAVAAACGVLLHFLVYRPMQRRGAKTVSIFVASLGANFAISAVLQICYGPALKHFEYNKLFQAHHVAGLDVSWLGVCCVAVGLLVAGSITSFVRATSWGQQVRAVGSSAEVAELAGVRTGLIVASVFAVSSIVAVIAGLLLGMQTSVSPPVDSTLTLLAAIAVLLAGRGSYAGTYLAGLLLGVIEALAGAYAPGNWARASVFVVFVAVVLIRPRGLLVRRAT